MTASSSNGDFPIKHHPKPTVAKVGGPKKPKQARFSREETRSRILDAAEELFSTRDPGKVTVREIAEKAGVTHPLVHQYVGSKAEILDAVVQRGAPHRHQMIAENPEYREVMPILFTDVLERRVHTRSIVRSAMDGVEYAPFADRLETGRQLLELARRATDKGVTRLPAPGAMDSRVVLAASVALAYGWSATEDWLVPIFCLQDEDPEELRAQLVDVLRALGELVFPPGDSGAIVED